MPADSPYRASSLSATAAQVSAGNRARAQRSGTRNRNRSQAGSDYDYEHRRYATEHEHEHEHEHEGRVRGCAPGGMMKVHGYGNVARITGTEKYRMIHPNISGRISRRQAMAWTAGTLAVGWPSGSRLLAEDFPPRLDVDELYDAEVDTAIREGLSFLLSRQNTDGTFQTAEQGRWVGVCALAGLALLSRGVRPGIGPGGEGLLRIGTYVLGQVQASGFLSATGETSHGPMYDHGFGTLFLAELYGTDRNAAIRGKLAAAVDLIVRTQNQAGGWRYNPAPEDADLSVTVCQMMALRAARNAGIGVAKESIDRAVDYVRRSQNADGGFMYQYRVAGGESRFPLTAAAIVALFSAGIYQGAELDAAFAYLQANAAANSSVERNSFFYYAHYYSVQCFWHRGGEPWTAWYRGLKRTLLSLRNSQRGWFDYNSVEYGTAMACLILNMPRSLLPIFQR